MHAIVLAGAGRDFCAGYDLAGAYAGQGADAGDPPTAPQNATIDDDCWQLEQTQKKTLAMFDIHKPVIAQVQGNCLAGGTDLALMCDMVVAADDARIGFPAARANGTPPQNMFVYHVGPQWAKRLLMTGDWISGRDAARIGLVMEAVPAAELEAAVSELARRVALVDAELLSAHKRVVNLSLELAGARTMQRLSRRNGCARAPVARPSAQPVPCRHGRARLEDGAEEPRRAFRRRSGQARAPLRAASPQKALECAIRIFAQHTYIWVNPE